MHAARPQVLSSRLKMSSMCIGVYLEVQKTDKGHGYVDWDSKVVRRRVLYQYHIVTVKRT
jgi:hypothetical protein